MIYNLRELLGRALDGAGLEATSDIWQLSEHWSGALGPQIASRATPVRLVRGELTIAVAEAVWRQELALLAPRIAERLNEALGRDVVQRVRLVGGDARPSGELSGDRPRRRLPRTSSASAAPPSREAAAAPPARTSDELAAALRSLAAKRAERILADDAPPPARSTRPQAPPRGRW
jgi:hypothetical protein